MFYRVCGLVAVAYICGRIIDPPPDQELHPRPDMAEWSRPCVVNSMDLLHIDKFASQRVALNEDLQVSSAHLE